MSVPTRIGLLRVLDLKDLTSLDVLLVLHEVSRELGHRVGDESDHRILAQSNMDLPRAAMDARPSGEWLVQLEPGLPVEDLQVGLEDLDGQLEDNYAHGLLCTAIPYFVF